MSILSRLLGPLGTKIRKDKKREKRDKRHAKKAEKERRRFDKKFAKEKFMRHSALNPGQNSLLDYLSNNSRPENLQDNELYQAGKMNLLDLLKQTPEAYAQFKQPIMDEFQREIIPELANRFSIHGAQRGSSFQNALADAGGQVSSRLGALRAGMNQAGIQQALGYAQQPIENQLQGSRLALGTNPYTDVYRPPSFINEEPRERRQGVLQSILGSALPYFGAAAGAGVGGPVGSMIGGALGSSLNGIGNNRLTPAVSPVHYQNYLRV